MKLTRNPALMTLTNMRANGGRTVCTENLIRID